MTNQETNSCCDSNAANDSCAPVIRHLHSWCCNEPAPPNPQSQINVFYDALGVDGPDLGKQNGVSLSEVVTLPDEIQDYKWFRFGYYIRPDGGLKTNPCILLSNWISPQELVVSDCTLYGDPITNPEANISYIGNLQARIDLEQKTFTFNQRCGFNISRIAHTIGDIQTDIFHTAIYRLEAAHQPI